MATTTAPRQSRRKAASAPTADATSPKPSWPPCRNSKPPTPPRAKTNRSTPNSSTSSTTYAGRPTPLFFAERLTEQLGGAKIYLKREDLLHTGAHKINNCIGQALLARRMGKHRIIAETGAGQHGVATATVCALFGLECVVYMGAEDMRRQELNVFRMRLLGAEVRSVDSGSRTLKDAINEAMRDWVTNVRTTHYLLGSVLGAHPYPTMVRDFHRVIGEEARKQILKAEGKLPTAIIACVGGGSNAIGIFHAFLNDRDVAAHRRRSRRPRPLPRRARRPLRRRRRRQPRRLAGNLLLCAARPAPDRSPLPTPSQPDSTIPPSDPSTPGCTIKAAPNTSPPTTSEALDALRQLAHLEGIICALESAHAVAECIKRAPKMSSSDVVIVNISGRGDKDIGILRENLAL